MLNPSQCQKEKHFFLEASYSVQNFKAIMVWTWKKCDFSSLSDFILINKAAAAIFSNLACQEYTDGCENLSLFFSCIFWYSSFFVTKIAESL